VHEPQTRQRRLYQFREEVLRANFYEPRRLGDDLRLAGFRANREDPSRAIQAALIQNGSIPEISSGQHQGNLHTIRGHDQFEMRTDMLV
jgi:hypothetical protein